MTIHRYLTFNYKIVSHIVLSCFQVVMALETISMSNEYNAASRAEAATLLTCITKFDFVFVLVVTARLLAYLKPLSVNLQKRNLDLDKAFTAIETVKETLSEVNKLFHYTNFYIN